ncbi:DUF998 domain-containing protein [Amycolatopsis sp. H20-H5]|uniref:DUF998 domain-containing protein n=1 Tax=Amycolatopsis sp. H20-H5 TaxID=3046309 RepID=UPI002DB61463|nr:DUF998 domain-containing protein [Amycolatopsis sp. H20-H5]MEC3979310.1 DUF998 domain-containing protein [Amycolatopsis sp. H20-H5]
MDLETKDAVGFRPVPWWAVVSSLVAPVAMIGGWTVAAARQPAGYDSIRQTISALAGHGAQDRAIMTTGLAVLGVCHVVTALGLRPARWPGRVVLAVGGVATAVVAALPLPVSGPSGAHGVTALIAFLALVLWPVGAAFRRAPAAVLRRPMTVVAVTVLVSLLIAFGIALQNGDLVGLTERLLAGAQSLWPAIVVLGARFTISGERP